MSLSSEESRRYARHIVLKGIGAQGQQKLKAARVAIIGAGGLGSPAIAYLAAAGVGHIAIADGDLVSLSNLQRQIVHATGDISRNKAQSAGNFVAALNDNVRLSISETRIDAENASSFIAGADLVLDGSDNLSTRRIVAAVAEQVKIPLVSGAVSMFDGQLTVFAPHLTREDGRSYPRFCTLYPETADDGDLPSCEAAGIAGAVTGVIGSLMAMEAVKLITGAGEPLIGRVLLYDGRNARFSEFSYA